MPIPAYHLLFIIAIRDNPSAAAHSAHLAHPVGSVGKVGRVADSE